MWMSRRFLTVSIKWRTISLVNFMNKPAKKNPHAVALGRNGGKARKAALTPARRTEIARQAVMAHWDRVRAAREAAVLKQVKPKRRRAGSAGHV
jgi:hypothetical protein